MYNNVSAGRTYEQFKPMTMEYLKKILPKLPTKRLQDLKIDLDGEVGSLKAKARSESFNPEAQAKSNELKIQADELLKQYNLVNAWGNYNYWSPDTSSSGDFYWKLFVKEHQGEFGFGGKRRSKSSNKPKKSAKRSKSRRTRRQRK